MFSDLKIFSASVFSRIRVVIWLVGSVLGAISKPFGSNDIAEFPARFAFWFLIFSSSTLVGSLGNTLIKRYIGSHRPILSDALQIVFMVGVFTPMLVFLVNIFYFEKIFSGVEWLFCVQSVAVISLGVCIARRILPGFECVSYGFFGQGPMEPSEPVAAPEVIEPRLIRRLAADYEGPILRLSVRDHFVDVVTEKATHTIRIRFSDAIDEMDNVEGYCTHRSHWVARGAVLHSERDSGRIFLKMANQDLVPVSRKYKPDLVAAGLV